MKNMSKFCCFTPPQLLALTIAAALLSTSSIVEAKVQYRASWGNVSSTNDTTISGSMINGNVMTASAANEAIIWADNLSVARLLYNDVKAPLRIYIASNATGKSILKSVGATSSDENKNTLISIGGNTSLFDIGQNNTLLTATDGGKILLSNLSEANQAAVDSSSYNMTLATVNETDAQKTVTLELMSSDSNSKTLLATTGGAITLNGVVWMVGSTSVDSTGTDETQLGKINITTHAGNDSTTNIKKGSLLIFTDSSSVTDLNLTGTRLYLSTPYEVTTTDVSSQSVPQGSTNTTDNNNAYSTTATDFKGNTLTIYGNYTSNAYTEDDLFTSNSETISGGTTITAGGSNTNGENYATVASRITQLNYADKTVTNKNTLYFQTVLGDDDSVTDKLIVKGDTSGDTDVVVTNVGGTGALTSKGIEIIEVDGSSDGVFSLASRVVAGAYEYWLVKADENNASSYGYTNDDYGNWYLVNNTGSNNGDTPIERPETGSYLSLNLMANIMFVSRLWDRTGYARHFSLENDLQLECDESIEYQHCLPDRGAWVHVTRDKSSMTNRSGQVKTKIHSYIVQFGTDVLSFSTNGKNNIDIGVMANLGGGWSDSYSSVSGYSSRTKTRGWGIGGYATYYSDWLDRKGMYADTWISFNRFRHTVNGESLSQETYHSKGLTASVEVGYNYALQQQEYPQDENAFATQRTWFIQPQAQLVYLGVKSKTFTESNGTKIKWGDSNYLLRLGMRTSLRYANSTTGSVLEPYIEANWLHYTKDFSTTFDSTRVSSDTLRDVLELKTGLKREWNRQSYLWGNISTQFGRDNYRSYGLMLGYTYKF